MRRAHDDVQRKRRITGKLDLHSLIQLISRRHDDKDVHIAVGVRRAAGMRAKQYDFLRSEAFGNFARGTRITRIGTSAPRYQRMGGTAARVIVIAWSFEELPKVSRRGMVCLPRKVSAAAGTFHIGSISPY